MTNEKICALSDYIGKRDNFAHATGEGNISEETYSINLNNISIHMKELHKAFRDNLKELFMDFLLETYDNDYEKFIENAENFIFEKSLSFVDLSFICNIGLNQYRDKSEDFKDNFRFIKLRQIAFVYFCIENYGIRTKDDFKAQKNIPYYLFKYKDNVDDYIENELGISSYACFKYGDVFPLHECPECGEEQLTIDGNGDFICFACEEEFKKESM